MRFQGIEFEGLASRPFVGKKAKGRSTGLVGPSRIGDPVRSSPTRRKRVTSSDEPALTRPQGFRAPSIRLLFGEWVGNLDSQSVCPKGGFPDEVLSISA